MGIYFVVPCILGFLFVSGLHNYSSCLSDLCLLTLNISCLENINLKKFTLQPLIL